MIVGTAELDKHLRSITHDVGECDGITLRGRGSGSEPEYVGEDDLGIFAGFEWEAVEVNSKEM